MESAEYLYQAAPLTIPSEGRCWFQTFPCWAPGCQAGCRRGAGGEMSINQLENGLWSHNMMAFPQVPSIQDAVMFADLHSCLTLNLCKYLCTVSLPAIKSSISLTVLGTWLNSSAPYSVTMNSSSILIGQLQQYCQCWNIMHKSGYSKYWLGWAIYWIEPWHQKKGNKKNITF